MSDQPHLNRNPFYDERILRMLMNSLPPDWTERKKEYQARLQYADIRQFLAQPTVGKDADNDIVETCLRVFYGNGDHGWCLVKQTWPEVAVIEQRRKMKQVVDTAQYNMRQALEAVQSEILLDGHLGDVVDAALEKSVK